MGAKTFQVETAPQAWALPGISASARRGLPQVRLRDLEPCVIRGRQGHFDGFQDVP